MYAQVEKPKENKIQSVANEIFKKRNSSESTFQFVDNRPEAIAQRKIMEMGDVSQQAMQGGQLQAMVDNHSAHQMKGQMNVNDDVRLEKEVDLMGNQASSLSFSQDFSNKADLTSSHNSDLNTSDKNVVLQNCSIQRFQSGTTLPTKSR